MPNEKSKTHTQTEIGQALNNAVAAALGSPVLKGITDVRKRELRHYLSGILDAILDHRKEGYLKAEELVYVLTCGALFVHVLLVAKRNIKNLPMFQDIAVDLVKDNE